MFEDYDLNTPDGLFRLEAHIAWRQGWRFEPVQSIRNNRLVYHVWNPAGEQIRYMVHGSNPYLNDEIVLGTKLNIYRSDFHLYPAYAHTLDAAYSLLNGISFSITEVAGYARLINIGSSHYLNMPHNEPLALSICQAWLQYQNDLAVKDQETAS